MGENGRPDPESGRPAPADFTKGREFWSFRPVMIISPAVTDPAWPLTAIDRFILKQPKTKGLTRSSRPTSDADAGPPDLTGLPPTPDEVAAFLADDSPAAFARVDRLLASAAYGERWGRHWLTWFARRHRGR